MNPEGEEQPIDEALQPPISPIHRPSYHPRATEDRKRGTGIILGLATTQLSLMVALFACSVADGQINGFTPVHGFGIYEAIFGIVCSSFGIAGVCVSGIHARCLSITYLVLSVFATVNNFTLFVISSVALAVFDEGGASNSLYRKSNVGDGVIAFIALLQCILCIVSSSIACCKCCGYSWPSGVRRSIAANRAVFARLMLRIENSCPGENCPIVIRAVFPAKYSSGGGQSAYGNVPQKFRRIVDGSNAKYPNSEITWNFEPSSTLSDEIHFFVDDDATAYVVHIFPMGYSDSELGPFLEKGVNVAVEKHESKKCGMSKTV